jgi:hypothetical protein
MSASLTLQAGQNAAALTATAAQELATSHLYEKVSVGFRAGAADLRDGYWTMPVIYGFPGGAQFDVGIIRIDPKSSRVVFSSRDVKAAREYVRRRASSELPQAGAPNDLHPGVREDGA